MPDPYVPFNADWKDYPDVTTPVTAAALEHIEGGITEAISRAIVDAKGDLIAGTAPDAVARLAAGANDEVPIYDSSQTTGLKKAKIANAQIDNAAAIARSKLATQTTRIPIQLHTARASTLAGNSFWTVAAMTDYDWGRWEFVQDVEGKVYGSVMVPTNVAATPDAKVILVIAANATSGVTRLQVGVKDVSDAESLNPTLVDETAQDVTVPGTAYLRKDVEFNLTTDPAGEDILIVEVFHDGDHANDTLAVNTLLLGAYLEVDIV